MERNGLRFYGYKHWTLEETPRCFNVGKGVKKRPTQTSNRNHKWSAIVRRYGLRVEVCIGPIEHFDACTWEIENIVKENTFSTSHSHDDPNDIGCNLTKGGEGGLGKSDPLSSAHREHISIGLQKAYLNGRRVTTRTDGVRLGKSNIGRHLTDEHVQGISEKLKGKPKSEMHKLALRKPQRRRNMGTEGDVKQVIVVRRDLQMRKGKIASQVAHAAMMFLVDNDESQRSDELVIKLTPVEAMWLTGSFTKIVVGVDSEEALQDLIFKAEMSDVEVHSIVDAGKTEFDGVPTLTCAAFGPCTAEELDKITGNLKLI